MIAIWGFRADSQDVPVQQRFPVHETGQLPPHFAKPRAIERGKAQTGVRAHVEQDIAQGSITSE